MEINIYYVKNFLIFLQLLERVLMIVRVGGMIAAHINY